MSKTCTHVLAIFAAHSHHDCLLAVIADMWRDEGFRGKSAEIRITFPSLAWAAPCHTEQF